MVERLIGRHTLRFEPPSLIHLIARGDVTPEDAVGFAAFVREHAQGAAFLLSLNDLRELGNIGAETRRVAAHEFAGFHVGAMAIVGGGFRERLLIRMLLGALQLFWPDHRGMKLGFFDAEAAARDWLAERAREGAAGGTDRR